MQEPPTYPSGWEIVLFQTAAPAGFRRSTLNESPSP
jgi:hypothetical protein